MTYPINTIDLPCRLLRVQGGTFRLKAEGEFSTGQWAATPRSTGPRFERWSVQLDMLPFFKGASGDLRFEWEVFIAGLHGTAVAFRMWDPLRGLPRGAGAGIWNPRPNGQKSLGEYYIDGSHKIDNLYHIDGGSTYAYVAVAADRYSDTVVINGLVPSTLVFKAGDHISIGGNLYMVMADALSDSTGATAVLIAWRLWKAALVGDRVDLRCPSGRFVLTTQDEGTLTRTGSTGTASISAVEVPYL